MTMQPDSLRSHLYQQIQQQGGYISFATFMELALYHPEWGYYNNEKFIIGNQGDFITAPEISPLFAQCFAKQCQPILHHLQGGDILELGAGTSKFAQDLLLALHELNSLPNHYYIYEPHLQLRKKQQKNIRVKHQDIYARIIWLDTLPANFGGIIIANEVLDALPVHCFAIEKNKIKERGVGWDNNEFRWKINDAPTPLFDEIKKIRDLYLLPDSYHSEINLNITPFMQTLCHSLTKGIILFADYGYGQREYYHPARNNGTLRCFYQHHYHDQPLLHPGNQDITAHVDFTRVAELAIENDCELVGYTTQTAFLLACGLIELATAMEAHLSLKDTFHLHQAIKLLTLPTEMGETIKVMGLAKNISLDLMGFSLQDRRRDL